jgi:hypothetical protein
MEMQLVHSEGEFIRDMKYVEVPGIDAIWHQIWTDTISDYPRLASSAAHIYGHPRSFTESFGAYRPAPDLAMARYVLNEQIIRGITLTEGMSYGASSPRPTPPPGAPAPPAAPAAPSSASSATTTSIAPTTTTAPQRPRLPAAMADPGWPSLMDYIRRLTYVMSLGRPAASIALYLPSSSLWLGDSASDVAFVSSERMLAERQIDFDIINLDALATDLKAGPGTLETLSGNRYRTIILPSLALLSQPELDRLRVFAQGGGKVLFLGRAPALIYTRTILAARPATPSDFAFATVEASAQLPPTPTPPGAPPAAPPDPMVVPPAIEAALTRVVPTRDVVLDTPDPAVKVLTRRLQDADVYLFFNEGAQPIAHSVTLRTTGRTAEVWDPQTGSVSPTPLTRARDTVTVKLILQPYQTELLTIR